MPDMKCKDCGELMKVISGLHGIRLVRCEKCGRTINIRSQKALSKRWFDKQGDRNLREAVGHEPQDP